MQSRTARAGALMAHHPAWVGHLTGGSWMTPTEHSCSRKGGGCGWLNSTILTKIETTCDLEGWRANGPNTRSSGKIEDRLMHEIYSGRSEITRELSDTTSHTTEDNDTSTCMQSRNARAGALMAHDPAWVGHLKRGSWLTPTEHPCSRKGVTKIETTCNLEGWRANGPNTRSSGKIEDRLIHQIYSGRSEKTRKPSDLQRGIQTHHPWAGQPRAVRIRTDVQHRPMPFVLQTYAGRTNILYMQNMPPTRWRYNQQRWSTTWNLDCATLLCPC